MSVAPGDAARSDPPCLATTDAIVIHGANGVCGALRQERADASVVHVAVVALLLVGLIVGALESVARQRTFSGRWILIAAALVAGVPGSYFVWFVRADRPAMRPTVAATVQRALDRLEQQRQTGHCLGRPTGACEACVPLVRLSGVPSPACATSTHVEASLFGGGP